MIAALALGAFAVDSALERGVAAGVLFIAVVGLTVRLPGLRPTLLVAIAGIGLSVLGFYVSPPGGELWKALANRGAVVFAIAVTTLLVWRQKRQDARRDLAEARAARSEQQLRLTVESSPIGMLQVDGQGRIALVNREAEQLFGYGREELLGQPVEILVPELDRRAHATHRSSYLAETAPRRMGAGREIRGRRKDGRELSLEIGLAQTDTPDARWVLATIMDVSERKQLEAARGAQAMARRLLDAEEAQRKRIAREIHDALGQALTALKLDIGWLAAHLPTGQANLHARALEMEELASRTIDDVRRLSAELRPAILDDRGLLAAIRWQVRDFEKRTGLQCALILPQTEVGWDADRSTVAYRVLQESLTNVARHARARHVTVALWREQPGDALLEVRDDGCGIDAAQAALTASLGLVGMRERALLHGGMVEISGVPGEGTTVLLRLPCQPEQTCVEPEPPFSGAAAGPNAAIERI